MQLLRAGNQADGACDSPHQALKSVGAEKPKISSYGRLNAWSSGAGLPVSGILVLS